MAGGQSPQGPGGRNRPIAYAWASSRSPPTLAMSSAVNPAAATAGLTSLPSVICSYLIWLAPISKALDRRTRSATKCRSQNRTLGFFKKRGLDLLTTTGVCLFSPKSMYQRTLSSSDNGFSLTLRKLLCFSPLQLMAGFHFILIKPTFGEFWVLFNRRRIPIEVD